MAQDKLILAARDMGFFMDTIEVRFNGHLTMPGTSLSRSMLEDGEMGWCLGIGALQMPKECFYGKTIEACVEAACKQYDHQKASKQR